jgi:hypothetical protein
VDWESHEQAMLATNRLWQISICKLTHDLLPTHSMLHKFYGFTLLCPICNGKHETAPHVNSFETTIEPWIVIDHGVEAIEIS